MTPWEISINNSTHNSTDQPKPAPAERWTIQRLLKWTADFFRDHGSEQPRLDAEILLAEALECPRIELYTRFDEEPPEPIRSVFRDWVARHAEGEPVAYLVGHKEFFSIKFNVDSRVLIPRPETEHLVTEAIDVIRNLPEEQPTILDVGTGSGCVAIAICKHAPKAVLTACDISDEALAIARQNAEQTKVDDRIKFIKSDLLESVTTPAQFDLIVSNPPYIGHSEKGSIDSSVVDYEPHLALFSVGPQGTETIQQLVEQAAPRLKQEGYIMFEISPFIADACCELIEQHAAFSLERVVKDLSGHARIVVAKKTG